MPAKRTSQMDQEDEKWECLNSFPRQEVKLDIFEATPTKFHQSFTIQNTYFSSSCVSTCSKVIIIVSVIFALLESFLFGSIVYSFFGKVGMLIASSIVLVILMAGGRYRIMWSVSWWRSLRQSDAESQRVYEGSLNWTRSITYLIVFLITPIWIAVLAYVIITGEMLGDKFPENSRIVFVLITGVDVLIFVPVCACPTALYAACFWKRVITEEKRVENLQEIED